MKNEDKKRDLLGNCDEGVGTLIYVNFRVVDTITIYKVNNNPYFSMDIMYTERCKGGSFCLSLLNGFECFCETEHSKILANILIEKGFKAEDVKKIFESGHTTLTLSK